MRIDGRGRVALATLLCASLACSFLVPADGQELAIDNRCAREGILVEAPHYCGIHGVGPASDLAGLSLSGPRIRVDEFRIATPEGSFNVGDRAHLVLSGAFSFGEKYHLDDDTPGGHVTLEISHGGLLLCKEYWLVPQGMPTANFHVSVPIEGVEAGTARFQANLDVRGWEDRFPADVWGLASWISDLHRGPSAPELEIGPPYRAELVGPRPLEVEHEDDTIAGIRLHVDTMADGRVVRSTLDSTYGPHLEIDGVGSPADSRTEPVHSKRKRHEGCRYSPPHPEVVDLPFVNNDLNTRVFLSDGCRYRQAWRFADLVARDHPLPPPECEADEFYDPDACDCVESELAKIGARLIEVDEPDPGRFTPGGVEGIPPGPDEEIPPDEQPPPEPPPTPSCGDGVINTGAEACDGGDLGRQTCQKLGYDRGTLRCGPGCDFDVSGCIDDPPSEECSNGAREGGEECDGADLDSTTCEERGYDGGTLGCTDTCTFDHSGCFRDGPDEPAGPKLVATPKRIEKKHLRGKDDCPDALKRVRVTNEGGGEITFRILGPLPRWLDTDLMRGSVPGIIQPHFTCRVPAGEFDLDHTLLVQAVRADTGEDVGAPAEVLILVRVRGQ